jgi:CRP/FNR family transcriptional regulator, cyclic AMP receptor protein
MPPMLRITTPRSSVDAEALLRSAEGTTLATYQPGEIIFSQGDTPDSVMYVLAGGVKLSVLSRSGKEAILAMLEAGVFFGESALADCPVRLETATAMMATTHVLVLPKQQMIRVLHDQHAFSDLFIAHMLARNIRIEEDMVDQLFNSSDKRLARALLLLARRSTPGQTHRVVPKISQQTLADMVGTTRSRVNLFMRRFEKLGYIDYSNGLKVNDSLLNVILRDERARTRPQRRRSA